MLYEPPGTIDKILKVIQSLVIQLIIITTVRIRTPFVSPPHTFLKLAGSNLGATGTPTRLSIKFFHMFSATKPYIRFQTIAYPRLA